MQNEKCKIDIDKRSYNFALEVVKIVRGLPKETVRFELGKQVLRSATSIAANIEESQGAFSKQDFIYKMNTALKEAKETKLWLSLILDAQLVQKQSGHFIYLIRECKEITNILGKIIINAKQPKY